jgi:hypothetical protein
MKGPKSLQTKSPPKRGKKQYVQDEKNPKSLQTKNPPKRGKKKRVRNNEKTQVLTNPKNAPKNVDC